MMAARKGSVGIVRKLIQHGANVNLAKKVSSEGALYIVTGSVTACLFYAWLRKRKYCL